MSPRKRKSPSRRRRRRPRRSPLRLRGRFFQPGVARAITSPSGIVSGSLLAGGLLATGAPPVVCFLAGVAGWAVPVLRAMQRVPGFGRAAEPPQVEVVAIDDSWAAAVADAEDAVDRFQQSIEGCRGGPLRDRLTELEEDVLQSLESCHHLARAGAEAESARSQLDRGAIESAARLGAKGARAAARSQRQLVRDLLQVESDARMRLTLINGRLDEAVGRAVEIVARAGPASLDEGDAITDVAGELRALSEALHEVDQHDHPHHQLVTERPRRGRGTVARG